MEVIFNYHDLKLYKSNTLILNATKKLKQMIKNNLKDKYSIVEEKDVFVKDIDKNDNTISRLVYDKVQSYLNNQSKLLIIDNLMGFLNNEDVNKLINQAKKKNVKLIIFDNELYMSYSEFRVIILYRDNIAISGKFKDVVLEEGIIKRLGFKLPFYVDLSIQLKLYGLIDKVCYTKEELEKVLWK